MFKRAVAMIKRLLSATVLLSLVAAAAHGALRSPQVPVSGTALQTFFASKGQAINVNTDQLDLQTVSLSVGSTIQIGAPIPGADGSTFGVYNAGTTSPPLYQIFPGAAASGWSAVLTFRSSPMRAVVNLFDNNGVAQGTNTYLGVDPSNLGFYLLQAPGAGGSVFYSQDSRNAAGARLLAFNATGALVGGTWFAWETGAGPGGDYADSVWLIGYSFAPVPVLQTNWGTLKQRFR